MPTQTQIVDQAVADAKNLPGLIDTLSKIDPSLAQQFTGKALIASKTVWGTVIGMGVSWLVTRYGLGWSPDVSAQVTGAIVVALTAVLRAITSSPITGLWSKPTPAAAPTPTA